MLQVQSLSHSDGDTDVKPCVSVCRFLPEHQNTDHLYQLERTLAVDYGSAEHSPAVSPKLVCQGLEEELGASVTYGGQQGR